MDRLKLAALALALLALATMAPGAAVAGGRPLTTALTGEAEVTNDGVPGQGDPDGVGTAELTLNPGQGEICWTIQVRDITLPAIGAHIHAAPAGSNGPVVVPLVPPDASGVSSGCAPVDRALVKAIMKNPSDYYVNVHTSDYRAGALRGQLG